MLFVDTSVWSLALRRAAPPKCPELDALEHALEIGGQVVTTGLVLQELLQGFAGPTARDAIVERFAALPFLVTSRDDHILAAELRNLCRRNGVQVGTIDALFAQLCIQRELTMLTTDADFTHMSTCCALSIWLP